VTPPVALTIAGSDSGGGAGIQADLKTFAALHVFGTCAITAVTAQNTAQVRGVHPLPVEIVRQQIEAVLDEFDVAAVKTGMLATPDIVDLVAEFADADRLPNLVVDPVMVSSSGSRLLDVTAEQHYLERL
jgi:hydroxymethylpyrimidine/phosphomethylpyrimidine kinase